MSELNDIRFFGSGDRKEKRDDGVITSQMPSWYFDRHVDELENEIASDESNLSRGAIEAYNMPEFMSSLEIKKGNLKRILDDKPMLNDGQKDALNKLYTTLGIEIRDSLATRSDDQKGLVQVYDEHKKNTLPHIKIDNNLRPMFKEMGITPQNGKISRNEASRAFKLAGKLLGQKTNVEFLRRDHGQPSQRFERSLDEMKSDSPFG